MRRVWMGLVVGVGLLAGCDDTLFGVPVGGGPGEPEYTSDWQGVEDMFADHCSDCHPGLNPWVLANLEADIRDGTEEFVVAGDAEASQLWRIISETRQEGDVPAMPLGLPPLRSSQRIHVQEWIDAGAPLPGDE